MRKFFNAGGGEDLASGSPAQEAEQPQQSANTDTTNAPGDAVEEKTKEEAPAAGSPAAE